MAVSTIKNPVFTPQYITDYTQWITPAEGVTINSATLSQYSDDIFYFYISASFATTVPARTRRSIGNIIPTYFDNHYLGNYCIAEVHQENSTTPYIGYIAFISSGNVQLINESDVAIKDVGCQGAVFRRIQTI